MVLIKVRGSTTPNTFDAMITVVVDDNITARREPGRSDGNFLLVSTQCLRIEEVLPLLKLLHAFGAICHHVPQRSA